MKSLIFAMCLGLAGCAAHSASPRPQATSKPDCECGDGCATREAGIQVAYEETADGAAMVFSSERADVDDVQDRVAKMAEKHNEPRLHRAPGHVAHQARVDNIAKGARLVMTPTEPSELDALRKHVRERVERIARGEAPTNSCGKQ